MSTLNPTSGSFPSRGGLPGFVQTLMNEIAVLSSAMLSPGRIIREVEQMRALQVEADRIQLSDPARAADLRRQASRIGLR